MYKQYIKQALQMFRENPLVSSISVAATALSIAVILVMVLVFQINSAGYSPVSNRERMLFVEGTTVTAKVKGDHNRGNMSSEVVKECFYSMKKPEAVSAYSSGERPLSLPGQQRYKEYRLIYTDPGYWKVMDYRFVEGSPFTEADFNAAIPKIVLSEKVAKSLFGSEKSVGKEVILDFVSYTVCGVVRDVSSLEMITYADAWLPYTCNDELMKLNSDYGEKMIGSFQVVLLAPTSADFDAVRAELDQQTKRYNESKVDYQVNFIDNPITQLDKAMGSGGFRKVDWKDYLVDAGAFLFLLLLVPALNLVGVIQSSVQKRREETALRKVFGARNSDLVLQVLTENMVMTTIGGLIGIVLSIVLLLLCQSFLLDGTLVLTPDKLFKPGLFLAAFLFTFLLNLLSAGIPAWRTTRQPVVDALKGSE